MSEDERQYGEHDMDQVRERIESKKDEFAGGPEPGWERLEEAAEEQERQVEQSGRPVPTNPEV